MPPRVLFPQKDEGLFTLPQERVAAVRPYWQQLPQEERASALTVDLATLRGRAKHLSERARAQAGEQQSLKSRGKSQAAGERRRGIGSSCCFLMRSMAATALYLWQMWLVVW
jgi:hypothetical protein